jgi:hypothetical protein
MQYLSEGSHRSPRLKLDAGSDLAAVKFDKIPSMDRANMTCFVDFEGHRVE